MENGLCVGLIVDVGGKEGLVLSTPVYEEKQFAIVKLGGGPKGPLLKVYNVVTDNGELFFGEEKSDEIIARVLADFAIEVYEENNAESV